MRWILHRGNTHGPNSVENNPTELLKLLKHNYEIEIDLWYNNSKLYLGHDKSEYEIDELFLEHIGLWIHCKDNKTFEYMNNYKKHLHYFYHTNEDYILTSKGYIWCYIGKEALYNSVVVMPEKCIKIYKWKELEEKNCIICSDYLEGHIKKLLS